MKKFCPAKALLGALWSAPTVAYIILARTRKRAFALRIAWRPTLASRLGDLPPK